MPLSALRSSQRELPLTGIAPEDKKTSSFSKYFSMLVAKGCRSEPLLRTVANNNGEARIMRVRIHADIQIPILFTLTSGRLRSLGTSLCPSEWDCGLEPGQRRCALGPGQTAVRRDGDANLRDGENARMQLRARCAVFEPIRPETAPWSTSPQSCPSLCEHEADDHHRDESGCV